MLRSQTSWQFLSVESSRMNEVKQNYKPDTDIRCVHARFSPRVAGMIWATLLNTCRENFQLSSAS